MWSAIKARLLDEPRVSLLQEQAFIGDERHVEFQEAIELIADVMEQVIGTGSVVETLAATGHIDAVPSADKTGGAFCVSAGTRIPPFVQVSYDGSLGSALTLAHELGHAVHFVLSGREQSSLSFDPPGLVAEVPAVFSELCLLERLRSIATTAEERRWLTYQKLDWSLSTVFRQARLTRFEDAAYRARSDGDVLTAGRLADLWVRLAREDHDAGVHIPAGYRHMWCLVPHFFHFRFYNYAFVFAHLVSLLLRARREEAGTSFRSDYRAMLAAGGSAAEPAGLCTPRPALAIINRSELLM
jgi:oligoendopeptidase F